MAASARERYDIDPEDGLRRDVVGQWHDEKHQRLKQYVAITQATRKKFSRNSPAYVDLYCATGRSRIRDTERVVDGSAVVAACSAAEKTPFAEIHVGDIDDENVRVCDLRLKHAGQENVRCYVGAAEKTAAEIVKNLNPYGLHLALLDPFNLAALPFSVVQTLATVRRMDMIVHISEMDMQRNVIGKQDFAGLDEFAPGWRDEVDLAQNVATIKVKVLEHWTKLVESLDYHVSDKLVRVTGSRNQPLYWLALASRNELADKFWGEIKGANPQSSFRF